ncbi:hypothetical protein Tco_0454095 [Tanacetum coccineum]
MCLSFAQRYERLLRLRKATEANKDNLSALMVTYPSTHRVYGCHVYMDGANMNAQSNLKKSFEHEHVDSMEVERGTTERIGCHPYVKMAILEESDAILKEQHIPLDLPTTLCPNAVETFDHMEIADLTSYRASMALRIADALATGGPVAGDIFSFFG